MGFRGRKQKKLNQIYRNRKKFRGGFIFVYFVVEQKPRNLIRVFMTYTANGS